MLLNYLKKIKSLTASWQIDIYIALLIFFVVISGIGLIHILIIWPEKQPIAIEKDGKIVPVNNYISTNNSGPKPQTTGDILQSKTILGKYVASKNGKNYYLPSCAGVSRIKEENRIWFATKGEAEHAGLIGAGNCPGL
ncbi:MAG: hypothetical protein Q7R91_01180 [bacterium]|nr:hypothetical protein [bacterium]